MDYIRRVPILEDDTPVDFPEEDRGLIVAFAAYHAREESWYTGGPQGDLKMDRNLQTRKRQAWRRARRTSAPRRVGLPRTTDRYSLVGG